MGRSAGVASMGSHVCWLAAARARNSPPTAPTHLSAWSCAHSRTDQSAEAVRKWAGLKGDQQTCVEGKGAGWCRGARSPPLASLSLSPLCCDTPHTLTHQLTWYTGPKWPA